MDLSALDFLEVDGPLAQRGIGIIAPFDLALERELWRWAPMEVSLHLARTPYEPVPVSMEMARLVSDSRHIATATRDVLHVEPEVVAYLCTSGSFVNGVDYERSLCKAICDAGAPDAVTTSGALAEVLHQLDVRRISVLTPYDADLTHSLHDFLAELGVETVSSDHLGLGGGIWKVSYRTIAERIIAANHPDAEAIFVSCTNLPTYDLIEPLEAALGKPVLTANQLTMWACLKRMNLPKVGPGDWLREVSLSPLVRLSTIQLEDLMTTIGFVYPDHAAEDDYPLAEKLLGSAVRLPVAHIYGTDLHAVPELLDLGAPHRLAEGARLLAEHSPDAIVWACTSGSFVYGPQGAHDQVAGLSEAAGGIPASSTSFAFTRAARALGLRKVAVAASYPGDVATLFVEFLAAAGIEVVAMSNHDIATAAEVGRMTPEAVAELISAQDQPDADALLIPDTAMRTLALVNTLEDRLGKPVLTANQVTIWEGLRLTGSTLTSDSLGTLLRTPPADAEVGGE